MSAVLDQLGGHECPAPLREEVDMFGIGDQFFSPAGRWETVTDIRRNFDGSINVTVYTDKTGLEYGWPLLSYSKYPRISGWDLDREMFMVIDDIRAFGTVIEAFIGPDPDAGCTKDAHVVVFASRNGSRGPDWTVTDFPDGHQRREQVVTSKPAARSLVRRLAKDHAKKLGVPMWVDAKAGAR